MACVCKQEMGGNHSDYYGVPTGAVITGQHPGKCGLPRDMSLDQAVTWLIYTWNLKSLFE